MSAQAEGRDDPSAVLGEFLDRARRGDDSGFRELYRALQPGLLRYLSVLVGPNEAEDVAAETWVHVCRDLHKFSGSDDGFRGWVTTIARNRALDLRRASTSRMAREDAHAAGATARTPSAESESLEGLGTLDALAMIATLPQDQAEAVLLRVVIGLDAKTAAQVLGKRSGAVRMAAHRGLRTLADRLAERRELGGK